MILYWFYPPYLRGMFFAFPLRGRWHEVPDEVLSEVSTSSVSCAEACLRQTGIAPLRGCDLSPQGEALYITQLLHKPHHVVYRTTSVYNTHTRTLHYIIFYKLFQVFYYIFVNFSLTSVMVFTPQTPLRFRCIWVSVSACDC